MAKKILRGLIALAVVAVIGVVLLLPKALPLQASAPAAAPELVERGEYLARVGDCIACHSVPGGQPYAGGLKMNTPFGVIVSANITPDRQTGIGGWSDEAFIRAMRHGVASDGTFLYPAMPYNDYAKVADDDLKAIKAFLDTVAPVNYQPPPNELPFPFNIRYLMIGWNLLFLDTAVYTPDPKRDADENRGRYLVDGLGHCTACHTAKNMLGGDKAYLQGGTLDGWYAPELSGNAYIGLGGWSVEEVASFLRRGGNRHAVASGSMAEAVTDSLQYLTDADARAIALYLKSLPGSARAKPAPVAANDARMVRGKAVYETNCAACHASSGAGVPQMVSAFTTPAVQSPDTTNLIRTVLTGGAGAVTHANPTGAGMPQFDWKLSDDDIAAVLTYVRNSWGNAAEPANPAAVAAARKSLGAKSALVMH